MEQVEQIRKIPHVLGVSDWKEMLACPLDAENVREHLGEDPFYENKVILIEAHMAVQNGVKTEDCMRNLSDCIQES